MGAGNVDIIKQPGTTDAEKAMLLMSAGLNKSQVEHCLYERNEYHEKLGMEKVSPIAAPDPRMGTVVERPQSQESQYGKGWKR